MTSLVFPRAEIVHDVQSSDAPVVAKSIGAFERIYRIGFVRKAVILAVLALAWEAYGRWLGNPLLFPTFSQTVEAFVTNIANGVIPQRMMVSLQTLVIGYSIGITLAALLTTLAIGSRIGADLLETLTSMFNPLPAIALLPLALLWFGLGSGSLVFVLIHSVLWAIALNTHSRLPLGAGTRCAWPASNYGLRGLSLCAAMILIPAALPAILTGLKIGWAFAWRTLIAAELVFGAASGSAASAGTSSRTATSSKPTNVFAGLVHS
jgi:NitT/TauT family transport system permease protein